MLNVLSDDGSRKTRDDEKNQKFQSLDFRVANLVSLVDAKCQAQKIKLKKLN